MAEKNDVALALLRRELPVPGSDLGPLYEPNVGDHLRDIDYLLGKKVEDYGEAIARALMAPGNALRGEYAPGIGSQTDPRMIGDAAELAGLVSLGTAPMPRPVGSLGMGMYWRRNRSAETPDNGAGYQMYYGGDPDRIYHYGDNLWRVDTDDIPAGSIIDAESSEFRRLAYRALREEGVESDLARDLVKDAAPEDIVTSAGLWDDMDSVNAIWNNALDKRGITAVQTPDGLISFDTGHATRVLDPESAAGSLGMGASVHSNIDLLAQELRARGIGTGTPQKSINRHGEYSAYMDTPLGEVRLSDHSNNPNFNTSAVNLYDFGDGTFNAAAEADRIASAIQQMRADRAAAKVAREAFIAPYAQRYKAATTNSERDAVLREYIENRTDGPRRWDEMSRNDRNSLRRLLMGGS